MFKAPSQKLAKLSERFLVEKSQNHCVFCSIGKGRQKCLEIASTSQCVAIMDINPLSLGHCLIIPRKHFTKLHSMDEKSMKAVSKMILRVAQAFKHVDYNILQNNGKLSLQTVPHVHFHLIPKRGLDDGLFAGFRRSESNMSKIKREAKRIRSLLKYLQKLFRVLF